jgi:hypothetical protein
MISQILAVPDNFNFVGEIAGFSKVAKPQDIVK